MPLRPVRVDAVPDTDFGVAYLGVSPTVSGLAIGAMVGGIGSILVTLLVFCFGLAGAQGGWGPLVAGAFAVLAGLLGIASVGAGVTARRMIRSGRPGVPSAGRGMAVSGIVCGAVGAGLAALGIVVAIVVVTA